MKIARQPTCLVAPRRRSKSAMGRFEGAEFLPPRPSCSRTFVAMVSGISTGVLGTTGLQGFIGYGLGHIVASLMVGKAAKMQPQRYFKDWWVLGGVGEPKSDLFRGETSSPPALASHAAGGRCGSRA